MHCWPSVKWQNHQHDDCGHFTGRRRRRFLWMVFNTVMNGFQYSHEWFSIQSWMVFNTVVNGFQYSHEWFSIQSWMVFNTVVNGFQYSREWFSIQSWMVFNTVMNGFQYSHEWFSIQSWMVFNTVMQADQTNTMYTTNEHQIAFCFPGTRTAHFHHPLHRMGVWVFRTLSKK